MGPALKGKKFLAHHKTGADLYNYTQKNMPLTDPGSVPEDVFSVHRRLLA
jgi:hypothetical protein